MALCDILVCLDPTAAGEARLKLAFSLAQADHAQVTGAYILTEHGGGGTVGPDMTPFILGPLTPTGNEAAMAQPSAATTPEAQVRRSAEQADIVEQRFREELRLRNLNGEWHLLGRGYARLLIELVHAVDLTILGQLSSEDGAADHIRPDDVVGAAGGPVLVVPYAGSFDHVGRRVLIAWDGTREATRALRDAIPVIGGAEAVTVMHVGTDDASLARTRPRLERIVRHLGHHGIAAKADETPRGRLPVADILLSRAFDLGADLIVTGAYHHSRLRETLLGGVSRDLLNHMTVPVLMSH